MNKGSIRRSTAVALLAAAVATGAVAAADTKPAEDKVVNPVREDLFCETLLVPTDPAKALEVAATAALSAKAGGMVDGLFKSTPLSGIFGGGEQEKPKAEEAEVDATTKALRKALKTELKYVPWLPSSIEKALGEQIRAERYPDNQMVKVLPSQVDPNKILQAHLDRFKPLFGKDVPYDFRFFVRQTQPGDTSITAEVLQGGIIVAARVAVPAEMPAANPAGWNEAQLRLSFLLAHEIAHVLKRHQTMQTQLMMVEFINGVDTIKDIIKAGDLKKAKVDNLIQLIVRTTLGYEVFHEGEADACAARLLTQAGIDANKASAAFLKTLAESKKAEKTGIWTTHPEPKDRKQRIQAAIDFWNKKKQAS